MKRTRNSFRQMEVVSVALYAMALITTVIGVLAFSFDLTPDWRFINAVKLMALVTFGNFVLLFPVYDYATHSICAEIMVLILCIGVIWPNLAIYALPAMMLIPMVYDIGSCIYAMYVS